MNIKHLSVSLLLLLASHPLMATTHDEAELRAKREHVIHQYILDLGKADYEDITRLFDDKGTVVSTSRGNVNAQEFFYGFLPSIQSATTAFHQSFMSTNDNNRYAARFHFDFKLNDGETGEGEYVDEFIFAKHSTKLITVYMFENLKFPV